MQGRPDARIILRIHGDTPLHIDVCDNGPGVPEALKPQLFTPFATGRADGLGLGLAIASQIMADFGGRLLLIPSPLGGAGRSEEHTSELQSLMRISYAVFCLKKKINHHNERSHCSTQFNISLIVLLFLITIYNTSCINLDY